MQTRESEESHNVPWPDEKRARTGPWRNYRIVKRVEFPFGDSATPTVMPMLVDLYDLSTVRSVVTRLYQPCVELVLKSGATHVCVGAVQDFVPED